MSAQDKPIFATLVRQLETRSIPRAREIQASLDRGERISDYDIDRLLEIITDTRYIVPVAERHEEYQELVKRVSGLYRGIIEQAVRNEQGAAP